MKLKVYTVNSFAKTMDGGNPAGVVLCADGLTDENMKAVAAKVNFSETAFVMESKLADFKVRFFTPAGEVELCGHATIAAFHVLSSLEEIQPGKYSQETRAGILLVEVKEDSTIMMEQNPPRFYEVLDKQEIAGSLNLTIEDMPEDLPVQIVSTGLRDIFVPVKNIGILHAIKPNFEAVAESGRNPGGNIMV